MFLPVLVFAAILTLPIIISLILIKIVHIDETLPQARVPASYWGRYAGATEVLNAGTVALHDPTRDVTSPTNVPSHAVSWHP